MLRRTFTKLFLSAAVPLLIGTEQFKFAPRYADATEPAKPVIPIESQFSPVIEALNGWNDARNSGYEGSLYAFVAEQPGYFVATPEELAIWHKRRREEAVWFTPDQQELLNSYNRKG